MYLASGIALQALAIFGLRQSRAAGRYKLAIVPAAVTGLILASALFAKALQTELGVTWSLVTISLVAYGLILYPFIGAKNIGHQRVPRRIRRMPAPPSGSKRRLAVRLFAAGPLALIMALGISLIIATKPWAVELTRLYTGGLLTPIFWSIGALHATVDSSLWRVFFLPILLTALAGAAYWFL